MKKYTWNQTSDFVTIKIPLEGKVPKLDIKSDNIVVPDILEGELFKTIYPKQSIWYTDIENGTKYLYIELMKVDTKDFEGVWHKLLLNDDTPAENITVNRPLREFSEEFRAQKIKEMHEMNERNI